MAPLYLIIPDKKDNFDMQHLINSAKEYLINIVPRLGGKPPRA
jgi:hypothetical protein